MSNQSTKRTLVNVFANLDTSHLVDNNIRFLNSEKYELKTIFIGKRKPKLYETLGDDGFSVAFYQCRGRTDLPRMVLKLVKVFREIKPDIVHTHLFDAAFSGLTAAKLLGIRNRVNTRHHAAELHSYHPHAVYYDRYLNSLSTRIVAITDMVADVLTQREGVPRDKVRVIRHGFDIEGFDRTFSSGGNLKSKYGLTDDYPVIGVVSRYMEGKGLQYIIPAFKRLLDRYPNAKLVLANAYGPYKATVDALLSGIAPERYRIIEFEREIFELYKSFDVFVHAPVSADYEAFGQVYIEALAMRVPSVFTRSGVAKDFIHDGFNAMVVPFRDTEAIENAILKILDDNDLRQRLVVNGFESIRKEFAVQRMTDELEDLYEQL